MFLKFFDETEDGRGLLPSISGERRILLKYARPYSLTHAQEARFLHLSSDAKKLRFG